MWEKRESTASFWLCHLLMQPLHGQNGSSTCSGPTLSRWCPKTKEHCTAFFCFIMMSRCRMCKLLPVCICLAALVWIPVWVNLCLCLCGEGWGGVGFVFTVCAQAVFICKSRGAYMPAYILLFCELLLLYGVCKWCFVRVWLERGAAANAFVACCLHGNWHPIKHRPQRLFVF